MSLSGKEIPKTQIDESNKAALQATTPAAEAAPAPKLKPKRKAPNRSKDYARVQVVMSPEQYADFQTYANYVQLERGEKYTMSQFFMDAMQEYITKGSGKDTYCNAIVKRSKIRHGRD